ncbi:MAG TPA: glycosyltransferase family 1 protein [Methylophilaceae bacterium]|nr:glycosyltransferase family 1 protein [Methylophilaceae bacterium]
MDGHNTPPVAGKLRLVLVTETWPPEINGVAMTLSRLIKGLAQRHWQVTLVRPRQRGEGRLAADVAIDHMLVPGFPIPGYSALRIGAPMFEKLRHAWKYDRPHVVHIATEGPLGWAALKAARSLGIPVSSSFHTNFHRYCRHYRMGWLVGLVSRHLRQFHNQCALTMVPNTALGRLLEADRYRNVVILGRGVDTALFSPMRRDETLREDWGLAPADIGVLYVGRIAAEKNLELVVRTFDAIRQVMPTARMIWVGDGPESKRLRKRHPDHVFCGSQVDEALAAHYASADLFLFPSMTETFGNVVPEAMASGLAVVAYDDAAASLLIEHGSNGELVALGDAAGFMDTAVRIARERDYLQRLRAEAPRISQAHSWGRVCDEFDRYLRLAMAGNSTLHPAPASGAAGLDADGTDLTDVRLSREHLEDTVLLEGAHTAGDGRR